MPKGLVLVDFENVQQVELSRLDIGCRVIIFVGSQQKSVPLELVRSSQKFGDRIVWEQVEGHGRNALDFFIAFHLGRVFEKEPDSECIILSRDKGFDPLLRYLMKHGLKCRRIEHIRELEADAAAQEDPAYRRVLELLRRAEKRSRPRKRKTLARLIASLFQKKIPQEEVDRIISRLMSSGMIAEENGVVTYRF